MGFYIRKSISVGPLRFNLSKSGIGVSAGIKGLRFGTGPRGNYVHMGVGGLYYKKTFPVNSQKIQSNRIENGFQYVDELNHEPLQEIESGDIDKLFDSSSEELVQEMNQKRKLVRIMPIVATIGSILSLMFLMNFDSGTPFFITILLTVIASYIASIKDDLRKSTVLFYDFEPEAESLFQRLHDAFDVMASSSKIWHIEAEGAVIDRKRNAGASAVLKRTEVRLSKNNPPFVKINIAIPSIPVGKQILYFFPDKILIFEDNKVGAVSYSNLSITIELTRFIEDGIVPKDAKIVDRTWKYVNKSGGPDKRFNNNRELPIALYEDISFQSHTGLNERIELSKVDVGQDYKLAINELAILSQSTHK